MIVGIQGKKKKEEMEEGGNRIKEANPILLLF